MSQDSYSTPTSRPKYAAIYAPTIVLLAVLAVSAWMIVEWTVNYVYVPTGQSLLLTYKGAPLPFLPGYFLENSSPGEFAKVDEHGSPLQKGVLSQLRGPGRHFYSPIWWGRELITDVVIKPKEVGIVTSKIGLPAPQGTILVEGELDNTQYKGTLRKSLGPGIYRVNNYAYDVQIVSTESTKNGNQIKYSGWVEILPGYVGVVTNQVDNPDHQMSRGIQKNTLPPGNYPLNPKEQQIDVVNIGFREMSIQTEHKTDSQGNTLFDEYGEPIISNTSSGISFPSKDGFKISMDFTAIWGVFPAEAADVISQYGNINAIRDKVVIPKVESICRNMGSRLGATELLVGDSRQAFQQNVSEEFKNELDDIDITLLYGLVRHIYIPQEIRDPIQKSFIADELTLTRQEEEKAAATKAQLRRAIAEVTTGVKTVIADTERLIQTKMAEAQKQSQEINAETIQKVAGIDKEIAKLEAEATITIGQAKANAQKMIEEAKAQKFKLAVEAFGSPQAYNKWVFANGLPDDMQLDLFYAGEGTFWTDLKGFTETMVGKQQAEKK